jgi:hypothetical protein
MIKKRDEVVKYVTIINRAIAEVPFANLFHRFKRTMSVLGRREYLETTVSMLPLWRFILEKSH